MSTKEEVRKESKMDMTPMIDCTFLLLIFFLCSIKFKQLEGKILAYLPKDVGVNATPIDKQLEKIEIHITRTQKPNLDDRAWVWDEKQLQIKISGMRVSLQELHQFVKKAHEANPDAKATLYPNLGTLYIDSVKVVNECLRANFTDITFAGAPAES